MTGADFVKGTRAFRSSDRGLTFGELEAFACTRLTVLLALFHAWVTTKKEGSFKNGTKFWIVLDKCACDSKTDSTDLTIDAAAFSCNDNVKLIYQLGFLKRLKNSILQGKCWKVVFEGAFVDCDFAGAVVDPCVCNGVFAAAGGAVDSSFAHNKMWKVSG